MSEIKCNISEFLNKKGMTQRELADAIGTTEVSISRYVTGERIPKATTCIQIAKVLDCKVEGLYTLQKEQQVSRGMIEQEEIEISLHDLKFIRDGYKNLAENGADNMRAVGKGVDCKVECKTYKELYEHYVKSLDMAIKALEKQILKQNDGWISIDERLPDTDDYILLSFSNFTIPVVGRYEIDKDGSGAFYIGDELETCVSQDMFVNAWMNLPAPYQPKGE